MTMNSLTPLHDLAYSDKTGVIIGAAIDVHRELGPGLLESVYEACMAHELGSRGVPFERQVSMPIIYKGSVVAEAPQSRVDLLVFDEVDVELKAIDKVHPVHECQLMTYLRLMRRRVGLHINFNVPMLRDGVTRRVL